MKTFSLAILIFMFCWPSFTWSQSESFTRVTDPELVEQKIRQVSAETMSITSDFTQEKHLTMMEEVLVSKGRFLFKKENKVRWEYLDPISYAILIDGSKFTINNDGKISEYDTESNKLFKEVNNIIVMAIQGDFIDHPDFDATILENSTFYYVQLIPRGEFVKDILSFIDIYFLKSNMAVETVQFNEPGNDYTKTIFTNRKVNEEIHDNQFNVN